MFKDKEEYTRVLDKIVNVPMFFHPWWLNAVCGDNWEVIISKNKGGEIRGALPVHKIKKFGFSVILQPKLTPLLGVIYNYPENIKKVNAKLSFEKSVSEDLIKGLPKYAFFTQMFHLNFTNWLPFFWEGFHQTTKYTYVLNDIKKHDNLYEGLKGSTRTEINAENNLKIDEVLDINSHYNLVAKSFNHQNKEVHYSFELLQRLDAAIVKNARRIILTATDDKGIIASIYIIIDNDKAYLLGIGLDRNRPSQGAVKKLIWEGILKSSEWVDTFDFEGSMSYNFEKVFRSFGASQQPYFHIYKWKNLPLEILYRLWKR